MMADIDMIVSQAMELLDPEKTQIFLDLLADMLPIFGSAGAIPGFIPNMAMSAIKDQVISFFEQARVVMNQIMTSLLSCLDSERLQKMPEPVFRALLEIIIECSLESKSNKAKGLCLEGKRLIVDDLQQFVETLGEKIPEKLLNRLNLGHEVVVYRFGDKNKRSQPAEKRENRLIHSIYFPSDCRLFIYIPTEKGSYWHDLEMQGSNRLKQRSEEKPATMNVYSNMVRNETCRMMTSIDMFVTEATHLFGTENTQVFFDLLAENMPHFESAGAISEFEPNMAESVTRQHVISFFGLANYVLTQMMTSLSSVPDSERLRQMPDPDFRALIERVIKSSLESKSHITKGLCLEGDKLIMDDMQQFIKTLGEKIPEKLLNRLNPGHEMVVYRFGDKNEERSQPTEKTENRLIHSIYFPPDCRLFISISSEKGSYWLEMQRANEKNQHGK